MRKATEVDKFNWVEDIRVRYGEGVVSLNDIWNPKEQPEGISNFHKITEKPSYEETKVQWFVVGEDKKIYEIENELDIQRTDTCLIEYKIYKTSQKEQGRMRIWELENGDPVTLLYLVSISRVSSKGGEK